MKFILSFTQKLSFSLVFFGLSLSAQNVQVTSVNFPSLPATSCTNTFIDVNITLLCNNAVHSGNSFTVSGSTITVDVEYTLGPICLGALAFPVHNINLGMLPAASYSVTVNGVLNGTSVSNTTLPLVVSSCCAAQPAFLVSNNSICPGDSISFTNTSTGQTSQQWFENNMAVGTAANYGKTYTTPGNYDIKLVVTDGNCADSLTQTIVVNSLPVVNLGQDAGVCFGGTRVLYAGTGHDSIRWSDSSTADSLVVSGAGLYYVTVFENGCENRDSIFISQYPDNSVSLGNDTIICMGDSLVLNVLQSGATYLWQDQSTNSNFTVTADGTYSVDVTDSNGCVSGDDIIVFFDTCQVGIEETFVALVAIYPNPVSNYLYLELEDNNWSLIEIRDVSGKLIQSKKVKLSEKQKINFDVSKMDNGIYTLKVIGINKTTSQLFVKK